MNFWDILGIEPTEDKKIIKKAYREKLREINPEDDPQGFMQLREAYEAVYSNKTTMAEILEAAELHSNDSDKDKPDFVMDAIKDSYDENRDETIAEIIDTENIFETPAFQSWNSKLESLYNDNTKRFDILSWKKLLDEENMVSIKKKELLSFGFLNFLGGHPFISREVAELMDSRLALRSRFDRLQEFFPPNLIDYFFNYVLITKELPEHKFFALYPLKNADYDKYINLYRKLCDSISNDDISTGCEIIKEMDNMGIRHPQTELKRIELKLIEPDNIFDFISAIEASWGEFPDLLSIKGNIYIENDPQTAESLYRKALLLAPDENELYISLAIALAEQNKFVEAKSAILEPDNYDLKKQYSNLLLNIEQKIIEQKYDIYNQGNASDDDIYQLAISYMNLGDYDNSKVFAEKLKNIPEFEMQYYKIFTLLYTFKEMWEKAAYACQRWLDIIKRDNEADRFFTECYMSMGIIKLFTKQKSAGQAYMDKAIELASDKKTYQLQKASLLDKFQFYEAAVDEYSDVLKDTPNDMLTVFMRGLSNFNAGDYQSAYEDLETVCQYDESALPAFIYKIKIFFEIEDTEKIEETYGQIIQLGFDGDAVRFIEARIDEYNEDYKAANKAYDQIINNYNEKNSNLERIGEIYYRKALVNIEMGKKYMTIFRIIEAGLAADPYYLPLLEKRHELNEELEFDDDCITDLEEIVKINPYHRLATDNLAYHYEEIGELEKAEEIINMQLDVEEDAENYLYKASNLIRQGNYESAWNNICMSEKLDNESTELYKTKAYYYTVIGDYSNALKYLQIIDELDDEFDYNEEIALVYLANGNIEKASDHFRLMLQNDNSEDVYELMYKISIGQGRYDMAMDYLKDWHESRDKFFKGDLYKYRQALIMLLKGQKLLATEALDILEVTLPESRDLFARINLYDGGLKTRKAHKLFKKGSREWPEHIDFFYYGALALITSNKLSDAGEYANEGIERQLKLENKGERLKDHYITLASLYSVGGDMNKAGEYFEKAAECPSCYKCPYTGCYKLHIRRGIYYYLTGNINGYEADFNRAEQFYPNNIDISGVRKLIDKGQL